MATVSLKTYLVHMDLKNWAFSLFDDGHPLNTYGFKYRRATPLIRSAAKVWTPDLIVWSRKIVLIIECKGGKPIDDDLVRAKSYADIPESALMELTGLSDFVRKVVLLYFKDMFEADPKEKEALLAKLSLEKDIVIWVCDRGFNVTSVKSGHGDSQLDSILKGGLGTPHILSQPIEIQPDSPISLLEKLLFNRLWERAFRYKDTRFTIGTAREILENHNYAIKNPEKKLNAAIDAGEKHGLCNMEQPGEVWKLNVILESPPSIENYLRRIDDILKYPELQEFSAVDA